MLTVLFAVTIVATTALEGKERKSNSKKQGWLGVSIRDVTPKLAREVKLSVKDGAYVSEVVDDSPADSAGITDGDIITEFNGKKIELADDLTHIVRETAPGTKVTVKVNRKGENKSLTLSVGKNPMRMPMAITIPRTPRIMINMFGDIEGMQLMDLNEQLGKYFDAPNGKGVLVKEVKEKSNAEKSGIKAGDVITAIGSESVSDVGDIREAIADLDEGDSVTIELLRKGKKSSVSLTVSEDDQENIYWRGDNFDFHFAPKMEQLERMQKELERKWKDLPLRERDIRRGVVWESQSDC